MLIVQGHAPSQPSSSAPGVTTHATRLGAALLAAVLCGSALATDADPAADAPAARTQPPQPQPAFASWAQALAAWRGPDDVNGWIAARFEYDNDRAMRLSESERAAGRAVAIHEPGAFFDRPVGICVDLARFGVETLRAIAPELRPRYLMIEFTPALHRGQVLRRHWIASFERDGGHYFFADSRFPGRLSGPYASVQAFVDEYATIRQRAVVAFRQQDSHRRQERSMQRRRPGAD